MNNFNEWLKSEDGNIAILNWNYSASYEDNEYDEYLKDKYEEYKHNNGFNDGGVLVKK